MNFICRRLIISDDDFLGCSIEFLNRMDATGRTSAEEKSTDAVKKYLLIQRTYAGELSESDYYEVQSSESETELRQGQKMTIEVDRRRFKIQWSGDEIVIGLEISNEDHVALIDMLRSKFSPAVNLI